jgi:FkbM family methyltransferase
MSKSARLPSKIALPVERLWLRALPTLTRDYLCVSVHGFRLYGSQQHQRLLYWLLKGSYERFTRKLFQRALAPGMRVLDLGANIGFYTLLAADTVGSTGRVYAFECDPDNARFLHHNVMLNGLSDVVSVVPKAAASHSGVMRFFSDTENSLKSSLVIEGSRAHTIDVECIPVDEVIEPQEKIDVVKVDVEGVEIDAIRGMERTLSRMEKLVMFVECCPYALSAAGGSVAELLEELDRHGFQVRVIDESQKSLTADRSELFAAERSDSKTYYVNLYCTKGS